MKSFFVWFSYLRFFDAVQYILKRFYHKKDPYLFQVRLKNKERISASIVPLLKYRKENVIDDLYLWKIKNEKWVANFDQIHGLHEYLIGHFENEYPSDYKGKTVLDIGGYIGDSARYFFRKGAAKVIVYEPAKKNLQCIERNLKEMMDRVHLEPKALSSNDGFIEIHSPVKEGHIGFGIGGKGQFVSRVQGEKLSTILSKYTVDIAKVDCEGQEKVLLEVDASLLSKVPLWMIEIHSKELQTKMNLKFLDANFRILRNYPNPSNPHCSITHYQLIR
jgi:FkbM family methyltransferase